MIAHLAPHYAHLYTHLGLTTWSNGSGLLIASKAAIAGFEQSNLSHTIFELKANPQDEASSLRVVAALLNSNEQARNLLADLKTKSVALPTLFVGETKADIATFLYDTGEESTNSNGNLAKQYDGSFTGEDLKENRIAPLKYEAGLPVVPNKLQYQKSEIIEGFDPSYNTRKAITDNHAVLATLAVTHK
jgi:hypothetical protein